MLHRDTHGGGLLGSSTSGVIVVSAIRAFYFAAIVLLVTSTVWVARVAPAELAVHFSFAGEPNGSMTCAVYVGVVLGLAALLCSASSCRSP